MWCYDVNYFDLSEGEVRPLHHLHSNWMFLLLTGNLHLPAANQVTASAEHIVGSLRWQNDLFTTLPSCNAFKMHTSYQLNPSLKPHSGLIVDNRTVVPISGGCTAFYVWHFKINGVPLDARSCYYRILVWISTFSKAPTRQSCSGTFFLNF